MGEGSEELDQALCRREVKKLHVLALRIDWILHWATSIARRLGQWHRCAELGEGMINSIRADEGGSRSDSRLES